MAEFFFNQIEGSGCQNIESRTFMHCDFRILECDKTNQQGIITDCDAVWNCNLCQTDNPYFIPVLRDQKFMLQTRYTDFVNTDPLAPTLGFGDWFFVELRNAKTNSTVSTTISDFASNYGIGTISSGFESYQTFEVDMSKPVFDNLECFYFIIKVQDTGGDEVKRLCTNHFRVANSCEYLVKIESTYDAFDCFGQYYGLPEAWIGNNATPLQFSNSMYIYASLLEGEDQVSKESFNGRVSTVQVIERYKVVLEKIVPAFMKNVISRVWVPGGKIYADDMLFEINEFGVDNRLTAAQAGRQFLFNIDMTRECSVDLQCKNFVETQNPFIAPVPIQANCVECIDVTCIGP